MALDRSKFIAAIRKAPFAGKLSAAQRAGIEHILDEWESRVAAGKWSADPRHLAYALATVFWETGKHMAPVREKGGEAYLRSKRYYPWVGEGLVQVTWETNARKFGAKKPGDCMSWPVALEALFRGMRDGVFTGKKLSHYFNATADDPVNARRIINGTDKAAAIAKLHREFLAAIEGAQSDDDDVPLPRSRPDAADKPEPFEGEVTPEPAVRPSTPTVPVPDDLQLKGDRELWHVQRRLSAMNYKPGGLDGKWGGLTGGAISGFINDRGLDLPAPTSMEMFRDIQDPLKAAITKAETERFTRPIAVERAEATDATVAKSAPEIVPVKQTRLAAIWTAISGFFLMIFNMIAESFRDAVEWVGSVKDLFTDIPTEIWFGLIIAVAAFIGWKASRGEKGISDAVKSGERL